MYCYYGVLKYYNTMTFPCENRLLKCLELQVRLELLVRGFSQSTWSTLRKRTCPRLTRALTESTYPRTTVTSDFTRSSLKRLRKPVALQLSDPHSLLTLLDFFILVDIILLCLYPGHKLMIDILWFYINIHNVVFL